MCVSDSTELFWTGEGWLFFFGPVRVTQIVVTGARADRCGESPAERERQPALSELERQTETEGNFISVIWRLYKLIKLSKKLESCRAKLLVINSGLFC